MARWTWPAYVGVIGGAVLFLAIALSAWASSYDVDLEITEALGTLGLTLFTFCVGLVSGATFFSSLRRSLAPILATAGVLVVSAVVAVGAGRVLGLDAPTVAGAWAGAVTNTPALAAALEGALTLRPSARDNLALRARQHVERHFSLETMVAETLDVYCALLGR